LHKIYTLKFLHLLIDYFIYEKEPPALFEYAATVSLVSKNDELNIYSKVIKILPKYIIVNNCIGDLQIMQENNKSGIILISSGSRTTFYWSNIEKEKSI